MIGRLSLRLDYVMNRSSRWKMGGVGGNADDRFVTEALHLLGASYTRAAVHVASACSFVQDVTQNCQRAVGWSDAPRLSSHKTNAK